MRRPGFDPWVGKISWRRERLPTPVFRPGEFHGPYSPWGHKESDMTEQLSLHFLQWCKVSLQLYSFACGCLVFSSTICWRDYSFPIEWFWHTCQKQFYHILKCLFLVFSSVSLIYMSVFTPERYCFDYHSFVIHF